MAKNKGNTNPKSASVKAENKVSSVENSNDTAQWFNTDKIICLICAVLAVYFASMFLFPFDTGVTGHDSSYHYLRIEALAQKIKNGEFFCGGIDYLFFGGAGYASSAAYPDLMIYIPALLRCIGVGVNQCMNIHIVLINAAVYASAFICAKSITKSEYAGTIAACTFLLCNYRIDTIYTRMAIGEATAAAFIPVIILGMYDMLFRDFKKPYILGLGFVCVILTHTISTAVLLGLCVILTIVFIKHMNVKKIIRLALTAVSAAAVTMFYWLPLFEMLGSADFGVKHNFFHPVNQCVEFWKMFSGESIKGTAAIVVVLVSLRMFIPKNSKAYKNMCSESGQKPDSMKFADVLSIIAILLLPLVSTVKVWEFLGTSGEFIQFPWRLYMFSNALAAIAGSIYLYNILRFTDSCEIGAIAVLIMMTVSVCGHKSVVGTNRIKYDDDHFQRIENTQSVGMGEWMPQKFLDNIDSAKEDISVCRIDSRYEVDFIREKDELSFKLDGGEHMYADVPLIWNKGYYAEDEKGNPLPVSISDKGYVRVSLEEVTSGEIKVHYRSTVIQIISFVVTIVYVSALFLAFIFSSVRNRKKITEKQI